jgi:hypothetical protein
VLAFKPRFYLDGGLLKVHPSAIEKECDYSKYKDNIRSIRDFDGFYFRKFKKDILKFPILFCLMRRPFRHIPIIYYLVVGILTKNFEKGYSNAFKEILKENARWVHKLYREPKSLNLLRKIIERFIESSRSRGVEPLLVIIPQPSDIKRKGAEAHESFFSEMEEILPVLDFTKLFKAEVDIDELYVDGPLGPHTSPRANQFIANTLANKIKSMNWTTET